MSSNLFTKYITTVSYNDIETFCNAKIPENVRVDYKVDFPGDLSKYIVGFANKFGGILLLGVEADKTSNIPTGIPGIPISDGLEEKVINISLANTNPPISPEVKICSFKSKNSLTTPDRAVVLIRIEESVEAPHMNLKNKDNRIYERIHNETRPADIDSIRKLLEKSEKGKKNLEQLISDYITVERHEGFRTFFALPSMPVKDIIYFNREVDKFMREAQPPTHLSFGDFKAIQNGVQFSHRNQSRTLITTDGLISYRELWKYKDFGKEVSNKISYDMTMYRLLKFLEYVISIYDYVGYYGKVCIGVELTGTANTYLYPSNSHIHLSREYICEEDTISIKEFYSFEELKNVKEIVQSLITSCYRCFGFVPEDTVLPQLLDKVR